ncbi:hypothetical protein D5086_027213 [Populus alba]|uniref:Uncharacterized protein n=1 Tax=Populus alba TaxID=43335 RepID=A0ACC4B5M9_POPAL
MQSFSSLRSALGSIPASFPLPSHGTFNSITRYAASPGKLNLSPCLHSISLVGSELNFSRITSHPRSKVNSVSTPSEKAAFTHKDHEKKCLLVKMCGITSAQDAVMAGAAPVGVSVDDDADTILRVADAANLEFVLLRGKGSRAAFLDLKGKNRMVYVLHANENGNLLNQISDEECSLIGFSWIAQQVAGKKMIYLHV